MAEGNTSTNGSEPCPPKAPVHHPCLVCQRYVYDITPLSGRYYGLLEYCDHPVCLFCVRDHAVQHLANTRYQRSTNPEWQVIYCPVCSVPSSCIVASRVLIADKRQKYRKIEALKRMMGDLPCIFIKQGLGGCFCLDVDHSYLLTSQLEYEEEHKDD